MLMHVNIRGSETGTQLIHHAHAVLQDSGKEVLQEAILGSEPTYLHVVFCHIDNRWRYFAQLVFGSCTV